MKDIELPPLSKFDHPEPRTMQWSDLELYAIKSYARAAIEADRAQRVPHPVYLSARALIDAARRDWPSSSVHRARVLDEVNALESALLASTPAPAQRECWCEKCDLAQGNPLGRTRMSICPECGDKRCHRAKHHDNACAQHQEPPQQERKPMMDEQAVKCIEAAGFKTWTSAHFRLVKEAERHHGIKE